MWWLAECCSILNKLKIIVCGVYGGWLNEARVIPQKLLLTTCSSILIVINYAVEFIFFLLLTVLLNVVIY